MMSSVQLLSMLSLSTSTKFELSNTLSPPITKW